MSKAYTVEDTIKQQAIELAGAFYEQNRSAKFRFAFPTVDDYLKGRWHKRHQDGSVRVTRYIPGWQHHVALARGMLVKMLTMPDARVSRQMKDRIADALIEDNGKSQKFGKKITQRRERDEHDEQVRETGRVSTGFRSDRRKAH